MRAVVDHIDCIPGKRHAPQSSAQCDSARLSLQLSRAAVRSVTSGSEALICGHTQVTPKPSRALNVFVAYQYH